MMKLTDYKVLTFDCYGTLIDWEAGIYAALQPLLAKATRPLSKDAVLETFARHESSQEAETPDMIYSDVLTAVHRRLADEWGIAASDADHRRFGNSVPDWPAFPDSAEALAYLKQHYKLVILSNVDRASFAGSNARLGVTFDAIYTAQDIGSYKPDLSNFHYMLDRLARARHRQVRYSAHGAEPVPRSCARQGRRTRFGLDRPPPRNRRLRRHDGSARVCGLRCPLQQHGRFRGRAPG